jgi:xanthine dehydrogenase YagR molybdenum-binding subunit
VQAQPWEETQRHSSAAFGAVYAEAWVDERLGTMRMPRVVGACDVGRAINPKTARSRCIGGMVGGPGMALGGRTEWDARFDTAMNANLAEHLVPVNADVPLLEAIFILDDDRRFDPLGVNGLAEVAIRDVAPAIANAVLQATGRRIRDLLITPERPLG